MNRNAPLIIGTLLLQGRLVLPPMATAHSTDGRVSEALVEYYEERAEHGHFSLIITEHSYVHPQGRASAQQLSFADDADLDGLHRLTDQIHRKGVPVFAQLNHAGRVAKPQEGEAVGPSAWINSQGMRVGSLSLDNIHAIRDAFVTAAVRAKKAGFDGVEIHSAHGYLLNQFYSPLANHRDDSYGPQTLENRTRLHCEILSGIRQVLGDYPLAIRLGGCDYQEGGSTIADCVQACQYFEREAVDLIDLSGGFCGYMRPDGNKDPGYFQDMSRAVREAVKVPVLLTGGVTKLEQAEALLENGAADLIGIGRAAFKNARWTEE